MSDQYDDDGEQPEDGKKPENPQEPDYEVGYGRPPRHTQYKEGQSGNPRGRPKNSRGLKTDLKAMLAEKIQITENGKSKTLTMQQLMLRSLGVQVTKGKVAAIKEMRELILLILGDGSEQEAKSVLNAAEKVMMDRFFEAFDTPPDPTAEDTPTDFEGEGDDQKSPPEQPSSDEEGADGPE